MSVDLLTHAFSVLMVTRPLENQMLIAFGVAGTVLPDIDILFRSVSDKNPGLYIFSHGGVTHSIAGAASVAILTFAVAVLLGISGLIDIPIIPVFLISILAIALMGSMLHVFLDWLAYPGIPLLYPFSDHKYTLGILPGPSLFLMCASVIYLILLLTGFAGLDDLIIYSAVFIGFLAMNIAKKIIIMQKFGGRTIPTFNPFSWLFVYEDAGSFTVKRWSVLKGVQETRKFPKSDRLIQDDLDAVSDLPEIRRLRYFSYFCVAERIDDNRIRIYDPLRENRWIFYPPFHSSATVHLPGSE